MNNYRLISVLDDKVVVADSGEGRSITNSIEAVLQHVNSNVVTLTNKRFLYYDSDGVLTEAEHDNGNFKSFKPAIQ